MSDKNIPIFMYIHENYNKIPIRHSPYWLPSL